MKSKLLARIVRAIPRGVWTRLKGKIHRYPRMSKIPHPTEPEQWARWYKANGKLQRQRSALKRLGYDVSRIPDLPRWAVK